MSTPHPPPESPAGPASTDDTAPGEPRRSAGPGDGPGHDPGTQPGTGADGFFDALRRAGIARSDDRWVGGVAAGVAERFRIDPLVVRGILFVTFFLSGAGLVLYGAAWALLPERRDGRIHAQEMFRGNFDVAMLGAIAAVVVGVSWGGGWGSWWDAVHLGWLNGLFWIAAIVTAAVVGVSVVNRRGACDQRDAQGRTPSGAEATWQEAPVQDAPWGSATNQAPVPGGTQDAPWSPADGPTVPGAPMPPASVHPPKPPKPPRTRGPGAATTGIVVGLSLLVGAFLLVVDRAGDLPWPVFLTWAGTSVVITGLAIVVSGLRGRTSGGLGWLAVLALVVAVPTAAWQDDPAGMLLDDSTRTVSDGTHRVSDAEIAKDGFGVRWGDPTIDLSGLDLSDATAADPVEVPVQLGAGDVTIVVPDGVPVRADVQVYAGSVLWTVDGSRQETGGISSRPLTFTNEEVDAGEEPLLLLTVDVGAGQALIEEN
ncbi:PspC domain-containing protein [Cellulosimicrobium arenosum]|uniref:PspC domain-containing protein n=1 Tax=Cellulosimicrobium arenosum TaxID=2708133 RepID=A0A927G8K0_9MICO|nr:PspC domain-containing protein [Cellulosimicrobium arenosum]MBD8078300.1 PspC domain-containing protein [Cellulosimicrobium arenosum]